MGGLQAGILPIIFVFFFLDLFDTVGTLIGVTQKRDCWLPMVASPEPAVPFWRMPWVKRHSLYIGTSTVTSYIESATGVIAAARTGLANMGAGVFFVMAMFLPPS